MTNLPTIGIAGGSGSGKTTFARLFLEALRLKGDPLSFDWYYRDLRHLSKPERDTVNWDEPSVLEAELLAQHLLELRRGHVVETPRYDFAEHARETQLIPYHPNRAVVTEGILLFAYPELLAQLDITIFVDTPEEVRLARRIQRDGRERGRSETSVRTQWTRTVQPMFKEHVDPTRALATFVIDGTQSFTPFITDLLARL